MLDALLPMIFFIVLFGFLQMNAKLDAIQKRVDELESKLISTMKVVGAEMPVRPLPPELLGLLQAGRKIEAIKVYREFTGKGLKEAKDAVEQIARENGLG